MKIEVRRTQDVVVMDIDGRLVAGVGAEQLRDSIDKLIGKREGKVLLNLEKVSRIDSTGVGELVASIKRAERGRLPGQAPQYCSSGSTYSGSGANSPAARFCGRRRGGPGRLPRRPLRQSFGLTLRVPRSKFHVSSSTFV